MKPHPIIQAIHRHLQNNHINSKIVEAPYAPSYIKVPLGPTIQGFVLQRGYKVFSINIATHKATVMMWAAAAAAAESIKTWNLADPKLLQELTNIIKSATHTNIQK